MAAYERSFYTILRSDRRKNYEVSVEDKGREMSLLFEGSLMEMEKSRC
jgi:hypothetical protein